jgi:hypothetical protein
LSHRITAHTISISIPGGPLKKDNIKTTGGHVSGIAISISCDAGLPVRA